MTYGYMNSARNTHNPIPLDTEINQTLGLRNAPDRPVGFQGGFPSFPADSLSPTRAGKFFPGASEQ